MCLYWAYVCLSLNVLYVKMHVCLWLYSRCRCLCVFVHVKFVCACMCMCMIQTCRVKPHRPGLLAAFLHRLCVCVSLACKTADVHIETGSKGAIYYSYKAWRGTASPAELYKLVWMWSGRSMSFSISWQCSLGKTGATVLSDNLQCHYSTIGRSPQ